MSYLIASFVSDLTILAGIHKWNTNRATELTAIATALGTDPSVHSAEMQTAPAGLIPGNAANTKFTNDVLLVVNAGKAGNLTPAAMGAAINGGLAQIFPPANTATPVASGTGTVGQVLTTTNGTWNYAPTSYQYQWMRNGANIAGATAATYTLVAADSGNGVLCAVTAVNAVGETTVTSNLIGVA
jgi:hypothetical protein